MMNFSFTHLTDIHIGSYQGILEVGGLNSRFLDFVKTYNEAIDFTIKNKCDFCLITGDIFKNKDPQPIEMDAFTFGLSKLIKADIMTVIVLGNHDVFLSPKLKNSISAIRTLNLDNVHISVDPELIYFKTKSNVKICVQTMPYQSKHLLGLQNHDQVRDYMIEKINEQYATKEKGVPCLFAGHFSISDSVIGTEQQTIKKFNEPIIPKEVFKNKKYVYCAMGHLHRYQEIMKSPPVVYGGSLNRIDFNEWKEDKGFVYGKFDGQFIYEFVKVNAKKFVDLEYNMTNDEDPEKQIIEDLKKRQGELKDSVVRISVNLSEKNILNYSAKTIIDFLSDSGAIIQGSAIPHVDKSEVITQGVYNEYMNSIDVLKIYCENNDKIQNKELFMKLAEEIIKDTNLKNKG